MLGKLYLVATPIGNLEDITLRAIKVLKEVDIIAAEDTRHTLQLLNHLNIKKPLISYYKEIEKTKSNLLINKLKGGENIAIVSDAGTPCISDPGMEIVKDAIQNDIKVVPIPGACAAINAIIASGLDTSEFYFIGFLPTNKKAKEEKLKKIENIESILIFYEAPHRLVKTLEMMLEILGDRKIVLAKEITKIHEEILRGNISKILKELDNIKGEFVIVVDKGKTADNEKNFLNNLSLDEHYKYYENQKLEKKDIIKKIAKDRGKNKNEIYQYFLKK